MFWLRLEATLLILLFAVGCSRFGVDSLIDENALSSSSGASISASLASNLKADMVAAGVDETSANLIAQEALSLSSSLSGSIMMAYSIDGQVMQAQASASLYQQISEKFIEGAMAGIAKAALAQPDDWNDTLKIAAAGVNSYTPIRTMAESASAGMSEADKQAAVEAISAKAVAKLTSTGIDTTSAEFKTALTTISQKAVEGVSESGVSASAAREMVKKAAGGATKGLSEMGVSAAEVQDFVADVASGATKGISAFSSSGDTAATDLLADVTSGLSTGLADVQDNVTGFDMYSALTAAEGSITAEASNTLRISDSGAVSDAINSGKSEVSLPSPAPIAKNNDDTSAVLDAATKIVSGSAINVSFLAEVDGVSATICYTKDDDTSPASPACTATDSAASCTTGTTYTSPIYVNSDTTIKAIACMAGKSASPVKSYAFQLSVGAPTFSVAAGALNYSNNTVTINKYSGFGSATTCYTTGDSTPACTAAATCSTGATYANENITISENTTLKAISCQDGLAASSETSAAYTYQLSAPSIVVNSGTVTIDNTNETGAHICYTTESSQTPQCGTTAETCNVGSLNTASFSYNAADTYKALTCRLNATSSNVSQGVVAHISLSGFTSGNSPCLAAKNAGYTNNGHYVINGSLQVYCDMTTEGGGWTLFAVTTATACAENLPYGPNTLTSLTDGAYFSTFLKGTNHTDFLQVMKGDGTNVDFTILYDFTSGSKTLKDRMNNAVSSGETVNWIVKNGDGTTQLASYTEKKWYYSAGVSLTDTKWNGNGNSLSADDGIWGAANSDLNGDSHTENIPGVGLTTNSGSYGHGVLDHGDSQCGSLYNASNDDKVVSGEATSNLKNYMFLR